MLKNYKKIELPSSYAWEVMENEIELELSTSVNLDIVSKLLELYALGVEYFQSMQSYKYLYFQRKMNGLMVSPQVMKSMNEKVAAEQTINNPQNSPVKQPQGPKNNINNSNNGNSPTGPKPGMPSPDKTNTKSRAQLQEQDDRRRQMIIAKNKQEEFEKNVLYQTAEVVNTDKVKSIIENTEKNALDLASKIQKELSDQNSKLQDRMNRRKQNAYKKSLSLADLTRHSSEGSLGEDPVEKRMSQNTKRAPVRVDFANIINQNQDESEKQSEKDTQQNNPNAEVKQNQEKQVSKKQGQKNRPRNNSIKIDYLYEEDRRKTRYRTYSLGLPSVQSLHSDDD